MSIPPSFILLLLGAKKKKVLAKFLSQKWSLQAEVLLSHYNDGHNIFRIFDTLAIFLFTTRETKHDY